MDQQKAEKFFNNTCTPKEAKQVLEWFVTAEGQAYLAKRWDKDAESLRDNNIKPLLRELNSTEMWKGIKAGMSPAKKYSRRRIVSYRYVAAIILVVCSVSFFLYWQGNSNRQIVNKEQPLHFITGAGQQKAFTLRDGTKIRLNSNSQLWIARDYGRPNRDITLKGEAYFEVKHNENHPFIIHVHGALIKDLGTAFNVRAIPAENNVQVAVKKGEVSFYSKHQSKKEAVKLTHGQFGYLNLKTDSISIDTFAIKNYLSWMDKRFRFDNAPLEKVSKQLGRIYNITFEYAADSLKSMRLSANFERGSLKKALAVVSLTLSLDYQIKNHHVIWRREK